MSKIKTSIRIVKLLKNYPVWFMNRFGLTSKGKVSSYQLRNGIKYEINNTDYNLLNHIWNYDVYRKGSIKKGDIVLDIGSHVGIFSVLASKLVGDSGKVFSFEPSPNNFYLLKKNIKLNDINNITAINKGVSNKQGVKKLFLSLFGYGGNSFFKNQNKKDFINIDCISLTEAIEKNKIKKIDFLKMDCEGAEYEILFSSPDDTLNKIKRISMESHDIKKYFINDLKKFLEEKGFSVKIGESYGEGVRMLYAINKNRNI